jgi:two-component system response regulator AtoC
MNHNILIVDDEEEMCISLKELLSDEGYDVSCASDPRKVTDLLKKVVFDLLIMDVKMPYIGGLDLLQVVKRDNNPTPVIMITGYPSVENAVRAMRYGALNFYTKPIKIRAFLKEIRQLFDSQGEVRISGTEDKTSIHTVNPLMKKLITNVKKVAPTDVPVIITGESGTGKEHVANMLHKYSDRNAGPFVKVNCAAIPDNLLESELFGHEKGAFTDAVSSREGKFELANGGTIFLDEIGDMSMSTQAKMLRVLEEKKFERLGSNKVYSTDTRVISATNRPLDGLMHEGGFREELYYRLSVVLIELIPLRERREDIILLADYFLSYFNGRYNKRIRAISEEVKGVFMSHEWPGNVRELKNCIQRAVIFCETDKIERCDLSSQYSRVVSGHPCRGFRELYESLSREMILGALKKNNGNRQKAADFLKIHRKTLYNRMKKLGIQ